MHKSLSGLVFILAFIFTARGQEHTLTHDPATGQIDTVLLGNQLKEANIMDDLGYGKAADYLEGWLKQQPNPDSQELAGWWLRLAVFYAWSGEGKRAESQMAFEKYLLASSNQAVSTMHQSDRLLYRSLILNSAGSFSQAADSLVASILKRPPSGRLNRIVLTDSYGQLARIYKKTGDWVESSRNFEISIRLNREPERTAILAEDLSDWSSVLTSMNIADARAEAALNKALAIYTVRDSSRAKSQVLNELGVLYSRRGQNEESLNRFKQSLREKSREKDLDGMEYVAVISNIGNCYIYKAMYDSARFYFSLAIDYATRSEKLNNPINLTKLASLYANLGATYGKVEKHDQAIENFQIALNCLDPECSRADPSVNPRISQFSNELAEFTASKAHAFHNRYNLRHNQDDLVNGLNAFEIALQMMDTLRFLYSFESKRYKSSDAKIHFFNALDISLDLFELTQNHEYLEKAFKLSERSKSAILNEFLRTNQARKEMGKRAPWINREDSLKQMISDNKTLINKLTAEEGLQSDTVLRLRSIAEQLNLNLKNIRIQEQPNNPEYLKLVYTNNDYPPKVIQDLLQPHEAILDYTIVRNERLKSNLMVILVLTPDTLYSYRDTLPESLGQEIADFRRSIASHPDASVFQQFSSLSHLMYQYFIEPVEKFSGITKLFILPDEQTGFLPFETFLTDSIKPKGSDFRKLSYLNRRYQVSYISSHEQFYQFRSQEDKKVKSSLYAFAPFISEGASFDSIDLPPLEYSQKETDDLSRLFKTTINKDKDASESALRQALEHEAVISISTHSIMDQDTPMDSRLLLHASGTDDGSFYLYEILSLGMNSPLVILNACNTGTGDLQAGEGIMSIARGFQYAGVPSVITTLWPINDRSASRLMSLFFKNLRNGMDQREALTRARITYIDESDRISAAPCFWAGHVLIGNPGNLDFRTRRNHLIPVLSMLLLALAGIFIYARHKKVR